MMMTTTTTTTATTTTTTTESTGQTSLTTLLSATVNPEAIEDEGTPVWVPIVIVLVLALVVCGAVARFLFLRRKKAAASDGAAENTTGAADDKEMESARNEGAPVAAAVVSKNRKADAAKLKNKWLDLQAESETRNELHRDARVSAAAYLGSSERDFSEDGEKEEKEVVRSSSSSTRTDVDRTHYKLIPRAKKQSEKGSAFTAGYASTTAALNNTDNVVYDKVVLGSKKTDDVQDFT
jgi:hypothetical protein